MSWTDQRIDQLKALWDKGLTASQIAEELGGVSRNAVIGKAHRLGLKSRPSPVKANDMAAIKGRVRNKFMVFLL
jgi:GcrA cell cycle regulator